MDLQAKYTQQDVIRYAGRVVRDIGVIDHRAAEGDDFGVSSRMALLQTDFENLPETDAPPVKDRATYTARVETLASFCELAENDFEGGDDMQMIARYHVIRQHSAEFLADVNRAYGTSLQLR